MEPIGGMGVKQQGPTNAHGHCACGGVQFEIVGPLRPIIYCHCSMCRRTSGHFVAATACAREHLHLQPDSSLRWYQSSSVARRGFCEQCGSQLFWDPVAGTDISIMAGALDLPTGLVGGEHIHVASAGDYYEICDGLPQKAAD
jgi:hypothetical protein